MHSSYSLTHYVLGDQRKVSVYSLPSVVPDYVLTVPGAVTALSVSDDRCYVGTIKGGVLLFSVTGGKDSSFVSVARLNSAVTSLHSEGDLVAIGGENGECFLCMVTGFRGCSAASVTRIEKRTHSAPVVSILSNGTEIFALDSLGRVTMYPEGKSYDGVTSIAYKRYLFAGDGNLLFCKTAEAFATVMKSHRAIDGIRFSRTGSVVFLRSGRFVDVYDLNRRKLINSVCLVQDADHDATGSSGFDPSVQFVFDERRNQFLVVMCDSRVTIGNVADENVLAEEMERIRFRDYEIEEHIVDNNKEDEEEEMIKRRCRRRKVVESRYVTTGEPDYKSKAALTREDDGFGSGGEEDGGCEKRCVDEGARAADFQASSRAADARVDAPAWPRSNVGSFDADTCSILAYNAIGYIISMRDAFYNLVELRFHDRSKPPIVIKDSIFSNIGAFNEKYVFLCNGRSMSKFLYGIKIDECEYEEDVDLMCCNDLFYSITHGGNLRVFTMNGMEVVNTYFDTIECIHSDSKAVLVLSGNRIVRLALPKGGSVGNLRESRNGWQTLAYAFLPERFDVLSGAFWLFAGEHIYYAARNSVYALVNGLSLKVSDLNFKPLCVSNGYVISIKGISGEPSLEYVRVVIRPESLNCLVSGDLQKMNKLVEGRQEWKADMEAIVGVSLGHGEGQICQNVDAPVAKEELSGMTTEAKEYALLK